MAGIGAGYDLSTSTFSPDGRVFQVEYATKAVDSSPTVAVAICNDGVVFLADSMACGPELGHSNILQAKPAWRVFSIDDSIGAAVAGLLPDAQCIIRRAQKECREFYNEYGIKPPVSVLAQRVALYVHAYTLYWHIRPFGAAILLAGRDENGTCMFGYYKNSLYFLVSLYCIEASGACYKYRGMAIGKGKHIAKTELEKLNLQEISCKDGLADLCLLIMQSRDEETSKTNDVQIAWISPDSNYCFQLVPLDLSNRAKSIAQDKLRVIQQGS